MSKVSEWFKKAESLSERQKILLAAFLSIFIVFSVVFILTFVGNLLI